MAAGASPQRQSTSRRLVTYALIVVGLGLTAYAVGEQLPGHSHSTAAESPDDHEHDTHSGDSTDRDDGMSHDHGGGGHEVSLVDAAVTSGGYELVEVSRDGADAEFALRDSGGGEVADYDWVHGAYLHVVMVTPDLTRFEHVHPEIADDGTWRVTAPDDAEWHVVFESTPSGSASAVIVASHFDGESSTASLPTRSSTARISAADGTELVVDLRTTDTGMQFSVATADGSPAQGLEAYLEQPAHLVAFRVDDLSYVHLHPTSDIGDPVITYEGALPTGATYRLFLQFAVDGDVLTVPFTFVA